MMFIGADFIGCDGTEDLTLADLQFVCEEDAWEPVTGWVPGIDTVNLLDFQGRCEHQLVYVSAGLAEFWSMVLSEGGEPVTVEKGWYDANDYAAMDFSTNYKDEPVTFGESIQVCNLSGNADAAITFAGQVKAQPTITDLADTMSIANCAPVNLTISDLIFNCDEENWEPVEGWIPGVDTVNLLDAQGRCEHQLVYVSTGLAEFWSMVLSEGGEPVTVEKGWYDANDYAAMDFSTNYKDEPILAAGGVQVSVLSGAEATVQINSAIK